MIQQLLSPAVVATVRGMDADAQAAWLLTAEGIAFSKIAGNCFIGILSAVIGGTMYNKFKDTRLPDWLAFFSGKRCVAIMTALVSILASVVLLFVWPIIFDALVSLGNGVASMGGIGAGIYAFLNRLLIPTGCTTHSTTSSGSTPSASATCPTSGPATSWARTVPTGASACTCPVSSPA